MGTAVNSTFNLGISYTIPEGKKGDYEIVHMPYQAGDEFNLVTMRSAVMRGVKACKGKMDASGHFHQLKDKDGVWMADVPCECMDAQPFVDAAHGRVLIGGLGIGHVAARVAAKPDVKAVAVVEISAEVIHLVWRHLPAVLTKRKGIIVNQDIYVFLRTCGLEFDCAYFDIWRSDGERTMYEHIIPLRLMAKKIVRPDNIHFWNDDVMYGQILMGLDSAVQISWAKFASKSLTQIKKAYGNYGGLKVPFWAHVKEHNLNQEQALDYLRHEYIDLLRSERIWGMFESCGYGTNGYPKTKRG